MASNHEGKVVVSDTVANIEAPKDWGVYSVEWVEPRPEVVSEVSYWSSSILGKTPAALWEISRDVVEEIIIVNCLVALNQANLICLLNDSKVLPVINLESLVLAETTEGLIFDCFLKRCELVASLWNNCAIKLDRMNNLAESVKLGYILGRDDDSLILIDDHSRTSRGLKHDSIMLTSEEHIQLGEVFRELFKRGRKCGEDEVRWRTPIEVLAWESVGLLRVV